MERMPYCLYRLWGCVALLAVACFALTFSALPDPLAIRWRLDGSPKNWGTKFGYGVSMAIAFAVINLGIVVALRQIKDDNDLRMQEILWRFLRVPNADAWFATPDKQRQLYEKQRTELGWVAIMVNSMFLVSSYEFYQHNVGNPPFALPVWTMGAVMVVFIGRIIWARFFTFRMKE